MKKNKLLVVALVPMLCACSFSATEYSASQFKKLYDEQIAPKAKSDFIKGDQISFTKHVALSETSMKDYNYSLKTKDYPVYKERFQGEGNENSPLWKEYLGGGISYADSYKYTLGSIVMVETTKSASLAYEIDEGRVREDVTIDGKTEKVDVGTFKSETYTYTQTLVNNVPDDKGEYLDFVDVSIEYKYSVRTEKNLDGEVTLVKTTWDINETGSMINEVYNSTYLSYLELNVSRKAVITSTSYTNAYEGSYTGEGDEVTVKINEKQSSTTGTKSYDGETVGELVTDIVSELTKTVTTGDIKDGNKIKGHTYKCVAVDNGVETVDESYDYKNDMTYAKENAEPKSAFQRFDEDTNIDGAVANLKTVYAKTYSDASAALNSASKEKECLVKGDIAVIRIKESSSTMVEYQFDKKTGQPTRVVSYTDVDFNKLGKYTVKEDASFVY